MTSWSAAELVGHVVNRTMTDRPLRLRTIPCVCGGEITADVADPGPEVLRHNRSLRHLAWWAHMEARDWEQE